MLIAVNDLDPKMKKLKTLDGLKQEVDWNYVKAFAQNGLGRGLVGHSTQHPAFRMLGEIKGKKALDLVFKKGHFFSFSEMKTLRKNCFYLYDYVWHAANRIRRYEITPSDHKKKRPHTPFLHWPTFFSHFHKRWRKKIQICQKFIRPSQIGHDAKRHWFFAYLMNFINLEKMGYAYDCFDRSWGPQWGKSLEFNSGRMCSLKSLNGAFPKGVSFMKTLLALRKPHFQYITNDGGLGGSGENIYHWVFSRGKHLKCADHIEKENLRYRKRPPFFPKNISWEDF